MTQVSATYLQAMLAQQTGEVILPFLKIEHPDLAQTYRVVNNTEQIVRADGTYMPFPFRIPEPEQIEKKIPQVQVEIDNTDLEINDALQNLSGYPTITFFTALASSPDTIESGPYVFSFKDVQVNERTITGTLGYEDDVFAQQVPGQNYLPSNSPGLFT